MNLGQDYTAEALYDWLLFGHIVAAMAWVGGGLMLGVIALRAVRSGDPAAVARLVGGLRVVGPAVLMPATIAVVALGVWLVLDSEAWDFGQFWVQFALALFGAAFLIGVAHQSRAALAAERAGERGDGAESLRQLARWTWGYWLIVALLVVSAWDMVFKPGV